MKKTKDYRPIMSLEEMTTRLVHLSSDMLRTLEGVADGPEVLGDEARDEFVAWCEKRRPDVEAWKQEFINICMARNRYYDERREK